MDFSNNLGMDDGQKWLLWKISPEGTYLTVIPELVPKKWDINDIKKALIKNKVIDFDIAKIESVIKAASGQMERVGEPFEPFEEGKLRYMYLHVTPMQARFSVNVSILQTDYKISNADILFILAEKAVVYGIDYDIIDEIVSKEIFGQEFIIASASPPIAGKDAVVTEILPIDPDAKPFLNEDGSVDYKKWDNIRQVKRGEVICTRTPPTPGIPGVSLFGRPLSPTPGEDYSLPSGMNTRVIDQETKLVAATDGFLYRSGRDICVGNIYIINGDVCYKTGNIEYSGDVLVRGNVIAGFSIKASGNVSVEGIIESAHIESKNGNVFVKNSIFGQNNANIIAGKNISAENIQDAKVKAGKTLMVKGQIRNCKIETENLEMPVSGQVLSSSIAFRGRLRCGSIGGKTESLNEFTLVEDESRQYKKELQNINELSQKLNTAIELLESKLLTIDSSNTSPEAENQKKLLTSQLFSCNSSKEQLKTKRRRLLKLIEIMPDRDSLIITRSLFPVLKVSIFGSIKEFKQELLSLRIGWKDGAIKMESV
jgi:uncharacterized protein (DUF342 family)